MILSESMDYLHSTVFFFGMQRTGNRSAGSFCEMDKASSFRRAGGRFGRYQVRFIPRRRQIDKKGRLKTKCFSDDLLRDGIRTDYQSAPPAHSMPMAATDARPTATIASKNNTDTDIITSECLMKLLSEPSACPGGKRYGCRLVCTVRITLSRGILIRFT